MTAAAHHPVLRKRIFVIFLVAVLLPSLVLSYFGLETIRNEQHRQEQIILQNLEQSFSLAISSLESDLEDRISAVMSQIPSFNPSPDRSYFNQIHQAKARSSLVEDVFLLNRDFRISYPRAFHSGVFPEMSLEVAENSFLAEGGIYEARGNLENAILKYREGLRQSNSLKEDIALLVRVARCEYKLGHLHEARLNFQRIIDLDKGRISGIEVPYLLIAYDQAADIAFRLEPPRTAITIALDYYESVIMNFQHITEAQYNFYLSRLRNSINTHIAAADEDQLIRYQSLQSLEKITSAERSFRLLIEFQLLPEYRNLFYYMEGESRFRYFQAAVDDKMMSIALKAYSGDVQSDGIKGLIINESVIHEALLSRVESLNKQAYISLSLITPDTFPPERDTVNPFFSTAGFPGIQDLVPGYKVGATLGEDATMDNIYRGNIILYYILFATIIGLIFFGIVFIFRDISREGALSRMKTDFIANVSHEIKTPIATIRTLAENLKEGWIHKPEKQNSYFRMISSEAERLSYLAENILDFSRIEARKKIYRKEMVDPDTHLRKVIERFQLIHEGKNILLTTNISRDLPKIKISPEGIEQAILNLLDNAAKYSGPKKIIDFTAMQTNGQLVISVRDKGLGIPRSERKKIFEKFYRVDFKKNQKVPGSGIGLSLVKEIAEMHNGHIDVKSEPGKGSTFSLIIPVNHEQDTADRR